MRIKVCGITSLEDALLCASLGVDALGFNFYSASPRCLEPRKAREIIRRLPPFITCVGVFVNEPDPRDAREKAREAGVEWLQLHGDESPEYCSRLAGSPLIKALRLGDRLPPELGDYDVRAILLDTHDDERFGGTGRTFRWDLALPVAKLRPVILAGGLSPENVAAAIITAKPYAVDVCSGIEAAPGRKDPARLEAFVREVRNAG